MRTGGRIQYIVICGGNYHPSGFGAGDPRNLTDWAILEHVQTPEEARSSLALLRAAALKAEVTLV